VSTGRTIPVPTIAIHKLLNRKECKCKSKKCKTQYIVKFLIHYKTNNIL